MKNIVEKGIFVAFESAKVKAAECQPRGDYDPRADVIYNTATVGIVPYIYDLK